MLKCEYRNGVQPHNVKVQEYLQSLKRVPLKLQEIMANEGAYIVFFNGAITDNPEAKHKKGQQVEGRDGYSYPLDNFCAAYNCLLKAMLIGIEGDYLAVPSLFNPLLHEFGHSFDDIIGKHVRGCCMSEWHDVLQSLNTRTYPNRYFNNLDEFVANSVDLFYQSDRTNRQLSWLKPSMFHILRDLNSRYSL